MNTSTMRGSLVSALAIASACVSLAGCGSSSGGGVPPAASRATAAIEASGAPPAAPGNAPLDACAMISAEDITALLGVAVEGQSTTSAGFEDQPGCSWENPANSESVTLEIGTTDSAINNTVPPPEEGFPELRTPGPDGMMFYQTGAVEFAAGRRSNTVQVAVLSMLGDEADAAAVDLARKVSAQLQ